MQHRTSPWFRTLILACGLLAALTPAAANPTEVRQEAVALAWIEAHNAADVDAMAAVRKKYFQRSEVVDWQPGYQRMLDQLGHLDVRGVMIEGPGRLMVRVQPEKMEESALLVFEFHDDAIDQIRQIGMEIGGPDEGESGLPPVDLGDNWRSNRQVLDAYLAALATDGVWSGSVVIANRDGVLYEGASGLASREFRAPNTVDTRFDVGSCNKDYTRVAILQLEAAGKLTLDDTVGKHLPDYPNEVVRSSVTLRQLLEHRSGLGDYFTDEWWETPMSSLREVEDYIPIWGPKPLLSEPGQRERYSNFGYTVLGAVIEKVSGERYVDYVAKHVFEPAGMETTGFFETDAVEPDVAVGYTLSGPDGRLERPVKNIYLEPAKGGPWGKSYSTARDLYRFYAAMFDGRIVEGATNWLAGAWEGGALALGGAGPGLNAMVIAEDGLIVVALANMDPPVAQDLAEHLSGAIPR